MEKDLKKKRRRRNNIIKSLVLVIAFVVAVGGTFGMTMAYFGGKSDTKTQNLELKTGLWIDSKDITTVAGTQYVVPSQIVTPNCELVIKSSKASSDAAVVDADKASKGLLRAGIKFTSDSAAITLGGGATSFEVKSGATKVGNFVKWGAPVGDIQYYYFMPSSVTSISEAGTAAGDVMQVVDTTAGAVTYKFSPTITIPATLGNEAGGAKITLEVFYQVIQNEMYDASGNAVTINVKNISTLMDGMTGSAEF